METTETEVAKDIYDRLGDDLSRQIFTDYSLTGDCIFLQDRIETYEPGVESVGTLRRVR